jgi:hypothetical protein
MNESRLIEPRSIELEGLNPTEAGVAVDTLTVTPDVLHIPEKAPMTRLTIFKRWWTACSSVCMIFGGLILLSTGILYVCLYGIGQISPLILYNNFSPILRFDENATRVYMFGKSNPVEDAFIPYTLIAFSIQIVLGVCIIGLAIYGLISLCVQKRACYIVGSVLGFIFVVCMILFFCITFVPSIGLFVMGIPFILLCGCGAIFCFMIFINVLILCAMQLVTCLSALSFAFSNCLNGQPDGQPKSAKTSK